MLEGGEVDFCHLVDIFYCCWSEGESHNESDVLVPENQMICLSRGNDSFCSGSNYEF